MHETEQICLTKFAGSLIGYATYNHSIVYVTPETISVINVHSRPETAPINGSSVLNFVINNRNEVVVLYKQRYIQVRRMDRLREVVKKFQNINISQAQDYPLLKILNQELYLVYPSAIQIISLKDGSRSKYTDLVPQPEYHKIYDLNLLNLIQSLSIGVLHLRNRLIVAIIPCTITQLHIEGLSQVICLHPNIATMHPKTTYLAVLAEQFMVKIFDLISLKQICQIQLPSIDALIEIETDSQSSYLLVHYIAKQTGKPLRHFIYKVNEALYYNQSRGETECQQFILFFFELKSQDYLSPLNYHCQGSIHTFTLYYFKDQSLNLLVVNVVKSHKQSQQEIQSITDLEYWKENLEWRDIISTYLQLEEQNFGQSAKKLIYSEEERQLEEYYQIAKDFDKIVQKFSEILAQKSNHFKLTQKEIDQEWQTYLQTIAKERNFMRETMNLFKIDFKIVKEPHQERNLIGIELENCIKDIETRESRVDAKIREKKMQLESQQQIKKEKQNIQEHTNLTQAQIRKQQEQYQKFVAQYLAQIQKRQAEEAGNKGKSSAKPTQTDLSPRLTLQLPVLSEQERKLIQHKSLDLSQMSSLSSQKEEVNPAWHQFVLIMSQIDHQLSPLELSLGNLVKKMDKIQYSALQQIKTNQARLQDEMSINLQAEVKKNCRGMLSHLKDRITHQMNLSIEKLQKLEQKAIKQNQQTIQKFKEFAKLQVRHRIETYHRSRRQLQLTAHRICKQQAQLDNKSSL